MSSPYKSNNYELFYTILSYLMSAFTGALGILNWFQLLQLVLTLMVYGSVSVWARQSVDDFSFLAFGMLWLSIVLFCQYYYLQGAKNRNLWNRVSFMTGIQLLVLFISQAIPLQLASKPLSFVSSLMLLIEFVAGILFVFFRHWMANLGSGRRKRTKKE